MYGNRNDYTTTGGANLRGVGKCPVTYISTKSDETANHVYNSWDKIDCLVQERRNYSALTMEFRISCTNPSKYTQCVGPVSK